MISEKEKNFDIATQKLVKLSGDFDVILAGEYSFPYMVETLREVIKNPETYNSLITSNEQSGEQSFAQGLCLSLSCYIKINTGGDAVWTLMTGFRHWWLVHKASGKIFDITYDQFPRYYDYSKGAIEKRFGKAPIFTKIVSRQIKILGDILERKKKYAA